MNAERLYSIGGTEVFLQAGSPGYETMYWQAGMTIDADGSPRAYHPDGKSGLDALSSAGYPNSGWRNILAVARDNKPYIQSDKDPAPGFFVSMTTYRHRDSNGELMAAYDTRSWVNSEEVPYIVVPRMVRMSARGIVLGCLATVSYNGRTVDAVVADMGPRRLGEGSIKLAEMLKINTSPRNGGLEAKKVLYRIYPGVPALVNGIQYKLQRA
jgi:hypothetical protein